MSPYIEFPTNRRAAKPAARIDLLGWTLVALPHAAVLVVMVLTEGGPVAQSTFLGTWALFNCFWLVVLRRPAVAGTLSLGMIVALIQLSRLKYEMIWMTANFLDVWILDTDSISYALSVMPTLDRSILLSFALPIPILALVWWLDPFRVQRRWALLGAAPSFALIVAVSLANPQKDWEAFFS